MLAVCLRAAGSAVSGATRRSTERGPSRRGEYCPRREGFWKLFEPDRGAFWRFRIAFWAMGGLQNLKSGPAVSIWKDRLCQILMMDITSQREPNDGQSYRPIVEMFE